MHGDYGSQIRGRGVVGVAEDGFFEQCYEVVLGNPRRARFVGFAMHASPGMAAGVPCHRVVFKDGSLARGFAFGGEGVQRRMLEEEGVAFLPDGRVDMDRHLWEVL